MPVKPVTFKHLVVFSLFKATLGPIRLEIKSSHCKRVSGLISLTEYEEILFSKGTAAMCSTLAD